MEAKKKCVLGSAGNWLTKEPLGHTCKVTWKRKLCPLGMCVPDPLWGGASTSSHQEH